MEGLFSNSVEFGEAGIPPPLRRQARARGWHVWRFRGGRKKDIEWPRATEILLSAAATPSLSFLSLSLHSLSLSLSLSSSLYSVALVLSRRVCP